MAPTNKKRLLSYSPPSKSKRVATATTTSAAKKSVTKKPVTKLLSLLGFSSSKRTTIQIGTKLLLDESIYRGKCPPSVKEHMFVYEIVQVHDTGKLWKAQYKDQVVCVGGDKYRVYKEGSKCSGTCLFLVVVLFSLFSIF
jgi:hypothetical protein